MRATLRAALRRKPAVSSRLDILPASSRLVLLPSKHQDATVTWTAPVSEVSYNPTFMVDADSASRTLLLSRPVAKKNRRCIMGRRGWVASARHRNMLAPRLSGSKSVTSAAGRRALHAAAWKYLVPLAQVSAPKTPTSRMPSAGASAGQRRLFHASRRALSQPAGAAPSAPAQNPAAQDGTPAMQFNLSHTALEHRHVERALAQISDFRLPASYRHPLEAGTLRVLKWHVAPGDELASGMPLCDVTDGSSVASLEFFPPPAITRVVVTSIPHIANPVFPPPTEVRGEVVMPVLVHFRVASLATRERTPKDVSRVTESFYGMRTAYRLFGIAFAIFAIYLVLETDHLRDPAQRTRRENSIEIAERTLPSSVESYEKMQRLGAAASRLPKLSPITVVTPVRKLFCDAAGSSVVARAGGEDLFPWLREEGTEVIIWSFLGVRLALRLLEAVSPTQRDFDYLWHSGASDWVARGIRYSTDALPNRNPDNLIFFAPAEPASVSQYFNLRRKDGALTATRQTVLIPPYEADVKRGASRNDDVAMTNLRGLMNAWIYSGPSRLQPQPITEFLSSPAARPYVRRETLRFPHSVANVDDPLKKSLLGKAGTPVSAKPDPVGVPGDATAPASLVQPRSLVSSSTSSVPTVTPSGSNGQLDMWVVRTGWNAQLVKWGALSVPVLGRLVE
eukprot:TRINITY_DN11957_c0_g1_i1.p1 TRINITY_DN11957_c0_g1~~TRINITY_DN11957_c0_g1_i1.p1  ORF type:complete len:678 (+),score=114.74 TRINITY_DN11957_c0_g1_i1:117-2150(+)